nr:hypothetical protein BaRGS_029397 [Batillaria attramentaria]
MSASESSQGEVPNNFFFRLKQPIPSYLVALAVGDIASAEIGPRSRSHSWFGNLVTNANWSEFWLNEGFTMFAERRIVQELFGRPTMCLEAATGQALLRQHMNNTGMDHPLNKLRVVIEPGVDPDDTYNETPYEKGFAFVSYLQSLVGDTKQFDDFLKTYVAKFQFKLVIKNDYQEAFTAVRDFLHCQGKQKYTLPVYRALVKGSENARQFAQQVFAETKDKLHISVQGYVRQILDGKK